MTETAVSALRGPYWVYRPASAAGSSPVQAPRIDRRFDTPGLVAGSNRTSPSLSVTARLNLRLMASDDSSTRTLPWGELTDFDIFWVGSWRSMIRAPTLGIAASGTTKVSP